MFFCEFQSDSYWPLTCILHEGQTRITKFITADSTYK